MGSSVNSESVVKEENGVMEIISKRQLRLFGQMTTISQRIGAFFLLEREALLHLAFACAKIFIRFSSGLATHLEK